jgi:uncharacterized protein YbjT (DUF2867 family)
VISRDVRHPGHGTTQCWSPLSLSRSAQNTISRGASIEAKRSADTVDYTIEFAPVLRASNPGAVFSFLSGMGADQTGRSRVPFARYKGEAEKALLAGGFPRLYIFRPAYIDPVEPRKEPTLSYRLLRAIYPAFRVLLPNQVIRADDLARAMVDVAVRKTDGSDSQILKTVTSGRGGISSYR